MIILDGVHVSHASIAYFFDVHIAVIAYSFHVNRAPLNSMLYAILCQPASRSYLRTEWILFCGVRHVAILGSLVGCNLQYSLALRPKQISEAHVSNKLKEMNCIESLLAFHSRRCAAGHGCEGQISA